MGTDSNPFSFIWSLVLVISIISPDCWSIVEVELLPLISDRGMLFEEVCRGPLDIYWKYYKYIPALKNTFTYIYLHSIKSDIYPSSTLQNSTLWATFTHSFFSLTKIYLLVYGISLKFLHSVTFRLRKSPYVNDAFYFTCTFIF